MKIAFLADPLAGFKTYKDSTFAMMREAARRGHEIYAFEQGDLCDRAALTEVFRHHRPDAVIHLAAESHVDRSIDGPQAFIMSNVVGTFNLLEACRAHLASLPEPASDRQ